MTDPSPAVIDQEYELVDVDLLKLHPQNPNEGDVGQITESIDVNGFYGALIVQRSTNIVLAGNHRLVAARHQGLTEVPVIFVDVHDTRALKILLQDNRSTRLGMDNRETLVEVLTMLAMDASGLDGTGFDGDDLDAMLADMSREPDDKPTKQQSFNVSVRCESIEEQQRTLTRLLADGYDARIR